jgi:hypothetical protein
MCNAPSLGNTIVTKRARTDIAPRKENLMRYGIRLLFCLTIVFCTEAALAQTAAYVYVARPTHLDGFAAAADVN